jgi:type II secretory pathway pseudopilin PulG
LNYLLLLLLLGLATIVLTSLGEARQRAKYEKKAAEVNQIKTALELYNLDNDAYPQTGCLGRLSGTCFMSTFSGAATLRDFSKYINLPEFSSTIQLKEDAFVFLDNEIFTQNCASITLTGDFILWSFEADNNPSGAQCEQYEAVGGCCPSTGGCGSGFFCATKVN